MNEKFQDFHLLNFIFLKILMLEHFEIFLSSKIFKIN
jgi:hypothetical protein